MFVTKVLIVAIATAASRVAASYCYTDSTGFENGTFQPDYTTTSGGVISHNMHFAGFAIVNDGTPSSPNTGVSAGDDYPYFIAFNLASQGSSASQKPAMSGGSGYTSFNLRTVNMGCFEDKAGHSSSLPAVDCDITLTCIKNGKATASQTVEYTCGDNGGDCGSGLTNAPMQPASLDVSKFACCQKITFSATPAKEGGNPVAVGLDTFSWYYSTSSAVSGASSIATSNCGC